MLSRSKKGRFVSASEANRRQKASLQLSTLNKNSYKTVSNANCDMTVSESDSETTNSHSVTTQTETLNTDSCNEHDNTTVHGRRIV